MDVEWALLWHPEVLRLSKLKEWHVGETHFFGSQETNATGDFLFTKDSSNFVFGDDSYRLEEFSRRLNVRVRFVRNHTADYLAEIRSLQHVDLKVNRPSAVLDMIYQLDVVQRRKLVKTQISKLFESFDFEVWFCLVISFLVVGLLLSFIDVIKKEKGLRASFIHLFGLAFSDSPQRTKSNRILLFSWLTLTLVVSNSFKSLTRANLISKQKFWYRNLNELVNAPEELVMIKNSVTDKFIKIKSENESIYKEMKDVIKPVDFKQYFSYHLLSDIMRGEKIALGTSNYLDRARLIGGFENLVVHQLIDGPINEIRLFNKDSRLCSEALKIVQKMIETGSSIYFDVLWPVLFRGIIHKIDPEYEVSYRVNEDDFLTLKVAELGKLAQVVVASLSVCCVVLLVEVHSKSILKKLHDVNKLFRSVSF